MLSTTLSSKGQIVIPKAIRRQYELQAGQKLNIIDTKEGILLKPSDSFQETNIEEVAGILSYSGKNISLEEMQAAIATGVKKRKGK